jgi:hypothetical protein
LFDNGSVAELEKIQREYLTGSDRLHLDQWRKRSSAIKLAETIASLVSSILGWVRAGSFEGLLDSMAVSPFNRLIPTAPEIEACLTS